MSLETLALAQGAIVTVDGGRGFVIETRHDRFVITAAHCLPTLPPAHPLSYTEERTYHKLLGPIGSAPTISAECLFVDPVVDIAVLGEPDGQLYLEGEDEAFRAFVEATPALQVGVLADRCDAWLHTLDGGLGTVHGARR
jgi:hypothetical protein